MRLAAGRALLVAVALTVAGAARAQAVWDIVPTEREIPEEQRVAADLANARLHLGPIRILPAAAITNAGYDSNVFGTATDPVSDWSFTVAAGARLLMPLGTKMYLRASAFPTYTFYDKLADRRGFGGAFETAFLGFFNHLKLQLQGIGTEGFQKYSSELNTPVLTRSTGGFGRVEVDLARRFSLFANGSVQRVRYTEPVGGPPDIVEEVLINNRTDSIARGGLRYQISTDWSVDASAEHTWSTFELSPETRDNTSSAYQIGIHSGFRSLYLDLRGGYREGRAENGSSFPDFSTGTGAFYLSYVPIRWLEVQAYGRRGVSYSVSLDTPYFFENRIGGGLNFSVGSRAVLRGYAETGPNQYPVLPGTSFERRDDVLQYGGGLTYTISRNAVLGGLVTRYHYDYNTGLASVAYTRFTMNVNLGVEYTK